MRRSPEALERHEWRRLITPLFVHAEGWPQIAFVFPAIWIVGAIDELIFTRRQWMVLYFSSGVVGELAGYAWKPNGAGASVAGAGLPGGLAVQLQLKKTIQARVGGIFLLLGAVVLSVSRDIHGPLFLAGSAIAMFILRNQLANARAASSEMDGAFGGKFGR